MGRGDDRGAFVDPRPEQAQERPVAASILAEGRLVEDEEGGPPDELRGEREPALLAARERERVAPAEGCHREPEGVGDVAGPLPLPGGEAQQQVGLHRRTQEPALRVLHHVAGATGQVVRGEARGIGAGKADAAGRRPKEAHQEAPEGRLAAAVGAEEGNPLTGAHRQVHAAQHGDAPLEGEGDVVGLDDGLTGPRAAGRPEREGGQRLVGEPDARLRQHVAGAGQDLAGRPEAQRGAVRAEGQDEVGQRPGELGPVLDQHDRRGPGRSDRGEPGREGRRPGRVEVGGRLVEDEEARSRGEGPGEGETLLLTAGKTGRPPPLESREASLGQRVRDAGAHPLAGPAATLEAERDVVLGALHDELARGILEHDPDALDHGGGGPGVHHQAVHGELARHAPRDRPGHEPGDRPGERALARP